MALRWPCILAVAMHVLVEGASAAPVTVGFTGLIDFVDDPFGQLPGVVPGSPFGGSYTIDPDAVQLASEVGPGTFFHSGSGLGSLELAVAGIDLSRSFSNVEISNDITSQIGRIDAWTLPFSVGEIAALVAFTDSTLLRISDPSAFFVNTSLDGWDSSGVAIYDSQLDIVASGPFTEVFVIPEPSTLLLMSVGVVWLGRRRQGASPGNSR